MSAWASAWAGDGAGAALLLAQASGTASGAGHAALGGGRRFQTAPGATRSPPRPRCCAGTASGQAAARSRPGLQAHRPSRSFTQRRSSAPSLCCWRGGARRENARGHCRRPAPRTCRFGARHAHRAWFPAPTRAGSRPLPTVPSSPLSGPDPAKNFGLPNANRIQEADIGHTLEFPINVNPPGLPGTAGCREDENFRIARALIFFLLFSLFRLAAPEHLTGWGGRGEQLAAQCKRWRASRPLPAVQPSPGPAQDSRRPSPSLCGAPRGLLSRRCRSTRRSCPRARRAQKANA